MVHISHYFVTAFTWRFFFFLVYGYSLVLSIYSPPCFLVLEASFGERKRRNSGLVNETGLDTGVMWQMIATWADDDFLPCFMLMIGFLACLYCEDCAWRWFRWANFYAVKGMKPLRK